MKNEKKLLRQYRVYARLNWIEKEILNRKMQASGYKSRSGFLRELILSGKILHFNSEPIRNELRKINERISRTGNNINQITKHVNATQQIYSDDISEIKNQLDDLRELVGKIQEHISHFGV